jgi:hypothetical protein
MACGRRLQPLRYALREAAGRSHLFPRRVRHERWGKTYLRGSSPHDGERYVARLNPCPSFINTTQNSLPFRNQPLNRTTRFCSAPLSSKQSTTYIAKKPVPSLMWIGLAVLSPGRTGEIRERKSPVETTEDTPKAIAGNSIPILIKSGRRETESQYLLTRF